jgi:hypothetical protein
MQAFLKNRVLSDWNNPLSQDILESKQEGFDMVQEEQYRLHHKPFLLMWVVSFGVA